MAKLLRMSFRTEDLFAFNNAKPIITLVMPLNIDNASGQIVGGNSLHLWPVFKDILDPYASCLTPDVVDNDDVYLRVVHGYMLVKAEKDRGQAQIEVERAKIKRLCKGRYIG